MKTPNQFQTPISFYGKNANPTKFCRHLNDFQPIFCRLLAHERGRPLTTNEIAARSTRTPGVNKSLNSVQVESISQQVNWDSIYILDALAFMYGCRVDLTDAKEFRRINDYLSKKPNFEYLRRSPDWKTYYLPMLVRWRQGYGEGKPDSNIWPPVQKLLERLTPILDKKSLCHGHRQKDGLARKIMCALEPEQEIEPLADEDIR